MIIEIRNRQRRKPIDVRLLRSLTHELLTIHLGLTDVELGIHLVGARQMAQVNYQYLQHEGSTDVITFDHSSAPLPRPTLPTPIHGELFICVEDAELQAAEFNTSWTEEIVRYIVHGILHLCGFDDLKPALRREMKRKEGQLLRALSATHEFSKIGRASKPKMRRTKRSP